MTAHPAIRTLPATHGSPFCIGSRLTAHGSRLTDHGSRLTAHGSRLTAHGSRLTAHGLRPPAHCLLLTADSIRKGLCEAIMKGAKFVWSETRLFHAKRENM